MLRSVSFNKPHFEMEFSSVFVKILDENLCRPRQVFSRIGGIKWFRLINASWVSIAVNYFTNLCFKYVWEFVLRR